MWYMLINTGKVNKYKYDKKFSFTSVCLWITITLLFCMHFIHDRFYIKRNRWERCLTLFIIQLCAVIGQLHADKKYASACGFGR